MKRFGIWFLCGATVMAIICAFNYEASAIPPFKNEFFEVYVKEDSSDAKEQAFEELAGATTGKCWVCHVNMSPRGEKGLGKKLRNNYGKSLSGFLKKDDFSSERREAEPDKVKAEIQAALKKVEAMKSDPSDPKSPTYGELIASGKLPGNDVPDAEDLKKAIKEREEDDN